MAFLAPRLSHLWFHVHNYCILICDLAEENNFYLHKIHPFILWYLIISFSVAMCYMKCDVAYVMKFLIKGSKSYYILNSINQAKCYKYR